VKAVLAPELDEAGQQSAPHALPAPGTLDVDGEVGDEAVGLARVEGVEAPPADCCRGEKSATKR